MTRNVLWSRASVCLSVWLSAAACLHYCTDPDVTWGSGGGCPLVVHYWADLPSVHGLRCYDNTRNAWQSPAVIHQAHRTLHALCHVLRMPAKTPLASANIDAPAACAVPFRPYYGGVVTRTRNVSEYVLVLALCLVKISNVLARNRHAVAVWLCRRIQWQPIANRGEVWCPRLPCLRI